MSRLQQHQVKVAKGATVMVVSQIFSGRLNARLGATAIVIMFVTSSSLAALIYFGPGIRHKGPPTTKCLTSDIPFRQVVQF